MTSLGISAMMAISCIDPEEPDVGTSDVTLNEKLTVEEDWMHCDLGEYEVDNHIHWTGVNRAFTGEPANVEFNVKVEYLPTPCFAELNEINDFGDPHEAIQIWVELHRTSGIGESDVYIFAAMSADWADTLVGVGSLYGGFSAVFCRTLARHLVWVGQYDIADYHHASAWVALHELGHQFGIPGYPHPHEVDCEHCVMKEGGGPGSAWDRFSKPRPIQFCESCRSIVHDHIEDVVYYPLD